MKRMTRVAESLWTGGICKELNKLSVTKSAIQYHLVTALAWEVSARVDLVNTRFLPFFFPTSANTRPKGY